MVSNRSLLSLFDLVLDLRRSAGDSFSPICLWQLRIPCRWQLLCGPRAMKIALGFSFSQKLSFSRFSLALCGVSLVDVCVSGVVC